MKIKSDLFTKVAIAVLLTIVSISYANAQAATKLVTSLYKANGIRKVATWSKVELKKYFVEDLANAIYKTARKDQGIGFDILYHTPDSPNITNFKIGDEDSHHESSGQTVLTVSATFKNAGKEEETFFTIEPDELKIIEIDYNGQDKSLMNILADNESNPKSSDAETSSNEVFNEKEPKTVTDFYLLMPSGSYDLLPQGAGDSYLFREDDNLKGKTAITKFRKSLIKIEDIKNGYLRLESAMWDESWMEIALFKKSYSYIVAISQVECGPACGGDLQLLTFNNQKWTDVTKQFYPPLSKEARETEDCHFELPRVGRTLKMWCGNTEDDNDKGKEFKFEWDGTKFIGK